MENKINYFILGYQGFNYFKEKFDKEKFPSTILRIIDNGNQKINEQLHGMRRQFLLISIMVWVEVLEKLINHV